MKRSKSVVLTSAIAGASLSVTACDVPSSVPSAGTPVEAQSYASVDQCKQAGVAPPVECERAYAQAQTADTQNAPRFENQQTCEEQYGVSQCVPRNNGSFFTPLLTGFIVGQMLNGGGYRGAPMYRDRGGNYIGGAGQQLGRNYVNGRTTIGSNAFDGNARAAPTRVQSRSSVISRGGFGGGGGRSFGG